MDEDIGWGNIEKEADDMVIIEEDNEGSMQDKDADEGARETLYDEEYDKRSTNHERRRSRHRSKAKNHIPESVKKELQEVREMIQRIPGVPKPLEKATATSYADSPFTDEIARVEILKRFTVPYMKPYDGSRLPNGSIGTFANLVDAFNAQFANNWIFEKTTSDLYKIVQRRREPLRDYLTYFNREKVTITNCDVQTAIEAFRRGLKRDSPLYDELTKYPCSIMDNVQAKAMAQVRLEEDRREEDDMYYRPIRKISTTIPREYKPYMRNKRDEPYIYTISERVDWRKDPNLPPTYDSYGFEITPSVMIREFSKLGNVVKWPIKSSKPKTNPDSRLWLPLRIHEANSTCEKRTDTTTTNPPPPHHKVINFIAGGSDVCGATYFQAKRIARESNVHVARTNLQVSNIPIVYFDEEDRSGQREPQYDSLVISIHVGNCLIKRVLVDNGSAANIMMLTTLKKMGLAESDMLKKTTTLVGFSGEINRTMGKIVLPTYAQRVNLLKKFVILDCDSTYNIILGRPWIHDLKAIPSTSYH
ncbi:uncharacterized protein LOC141680652 [Apium graveolens]|uniref:uncharacterized protein LOC141680652 n=1 Tax=Apium graveolens TaxID=4045 RepID=UPI003D79E614